VQDGTNPSRLAKVEAEVAGLKSDVAGVKDDVRNVYNVVGNIDAKLTRYAQPQWGTIFAGLGIVGGVITTLGTLVFGFLYVMYGETKVEVKELTTHRLLTEFYRGQIDERINALFSKIKEDKVLTEKRYEDVQVLSDREMNHYNSILEKLNEKSVNPKP